MTHEDSIGEAAAAIRAGGVVAYPTEAVYGLGCDPDNELAVLRILDLKSRDAALGLVLVAADVHQLAPYVLPFTDEITARTAPTWPGPTTWVVPARTGAPRWLTGKQDGIAVRVTAHPLAAALCRAVGTAIVSTSANLHGCAPAKTADGVRAVFDGALDAIVDGACGGLARPTEIRDATTGRVLRPA